MATIHKLCVQRLRTLRWVFGLELDCCLSQVCGLEMQRFVDGQATRVLDANTDLTQSHGRERLRLNYGK